MITLWWIDVVTATSFFYFSLFRRRWIDIDASCFYYVYLSRIYIDFIFIFTSSRHLYFCLSLLVVDDAFELPLLLLLLLLVLPLLRCCRFCYCRCFCYCCYCCFYWWWLLLRYWYLIFKSNSISHSGTNWKTIYAWRNDWLLFFFLLLLFLYILLDRFFSI